jgi:predicted  nucleic acid-binding Zn-ribbon protein
MEGKGRAGALAQFRLSAQVISRANGRSSVAAAAYRAGERLHDERLDMLFDYERRDGVEHVEIMLPEDAPARFADRQTLWNEVEAVERRHDAQVAREVQISLPHELTFEQRQELVREFVQTAFVDRGMIADVAMHLPDKDGDERNYHAHILLTTRTVDADGFGKKERSWNHKDTLQDWREQWAEIQNRHLRQHLGPDAPQVTHKSLADQGIDREGTVHLGPTASAIERKGERSERGDTNREIAAANADRADWKSQKRAIEDELAQRAPQQPASPQGLQDEMRKLRDSMVAERAKWQTEIARMETPVVIKAHELRREIVSPARARVIEAERNLEATKARVDRISSRRMNLVSWVRNPQRMIWAKIREVHAMDRARREVARARAALKVRQQWVKGEQGQAYVLAKVDQSRAAARPLQSQQRTLERKIARVSKRIERIEKLQEKLRVAEKIGVRSLSRPITVRSPDQLVRNVDRAVMKAVGAFSPEQQKRAIEAARAMTRGLGLGR